MMRALQDHPPAKGADEEVDGTAVNLVGFAHWEDFEPYCDAITQGRRDLFGKEREAWKEWFSETEDALGVLVTVEISDDVEHFALIKAREDEWGSQRSAWATEVAETIVKNQKRN